MHEMLLKRQFQADDEEAKHVFGDRLLRFGDLNMHTAEAHAPLSRNTPEQLAAKTHTSRASNEQILWFRGARATPAHNRARSCIDSPC